MSDDMSRAKRGRRLLVFFVGIVFGASGAVLLPRYFPSVPWQGERLEGTVLEKRREADRLLLRVSTERGLVLATFSEKQDDIDLLVQREDVVVLRVGSFAPFAEDPALLSVRRPDSPVEAPLAATTREGALARLEAELEAWEREIERLREQAAAAGEGTRSRSRELLDRLQERQRAARARLSALAGASGEAWDELRDGVERAWSDLDAALEEASEEIETPPGEP